MDKIQIKKLILRWFGVSVFIALIYVIHYLVNEHIPQASRYGFMAMLMLCIIGLSIYLIRLRTNIPGKSLRYFTSMMWLLTILVLAPSLFVFFDKSNEPPDWNFPIMFVILVMWSAHGVFKHQQKRIDELEEKLNNHQERNQMKKHITQTGLSMVTIAALLLGGCTAPGMNRAHGGSSVLNKNGVPNRAFFVAEGLDIEFQAPAPGHIYLVDENSNKTVLVDPIEKGEPYDFDVTRFYPLDDETRELLTKEGFDPDNMRFSLYFVPNSAMFQSQKQNAFDNNGLPQKQYYVGGGYIINFQAPADGTAYLVEANLAKIIQTDSLSTGEEYVLEIDPADEEIKNRMIAMGLTPDNPRDMKFELYFVPLDDSQQENRPPKD